MDVVIIGAGQAGAAAAAKLRALGHQGKITLIGEETAPPYQRPPLSKAYLMGQMEQERLWLRAPSFWSDQKIDLRLGQKVDAIDTTAKTVSVGDEVIGYDELVLTTGSSPRMLPESIGGRLQGVYGVRGLADVDAMRAEFQAGRKVAIIGGGYIGLEAAAVASKLGLEVTLIEMAPRILQRVAAPETSDYFRALHQSHGVTILEATAMKRLRGDSRVSGVELADGRVIDADFVITGIGITPNAQLAQDAGIMLDNGIATNSFGQTFTAHVWSAGDCASFPWKGDRIRLESVGNAIDQAEAVAANILGAQEHYAANPWFWSDQYDIKLQIAGLNAGYTDVVTRQTGVGQSHWYYAGDQLIALDAMNDPRAYMVGKRLIEAGKSPDKALISDPQTELKDLLK